jgi:hypothetical protein
MAAEEPFLVSRFHDDLVEEEVQPVILALCQHTEIQKFAWRVVGQHIIYLPAVQFQRGLGAGVFLVRGHLLRPPVDVDFPLFLVRAFRSAEAEVLLPFQFQYAAPADVVHIASQRLHQPAEPLFGGVLFQQVIVLVAAIEEKDGVRPLAQPVQILLLGLAAVPHEAEIAQHNDKIALTGPAQPPVFEAVQLAVGVARKIYHPLPPFAECEIAPKALSRPAKPVIIKYKALR